MELEREGWRRGEDKTGEVGQRRERVARREKGRKEERRTAIGYAIDHLFAVQHLQKTRSACQHGEAGCQAGSKT
jgi:hypothetical protein